jgi:hypothetical protein
MATNGTRDSGNELHDRLVGHPQRIFADAPPERFRRDLLFAGKAAIKSVDQNVCVN